MTNAQIQQKRLIEAILDNAPARVRLSIDAGADPNVVDHDAHDIWRLFSSAKTIGSFPLYEAVSQASKRSDMHDDVAVIEKLLQHGAQVNQVDDLGYSAAHVASSLRNEPALRVLMANGADLSLCSTKGYTPIHTAIFGKAGACLNLMLSALQGQDSRYSPVNLAGGVGISPLAYAKKLGRHEMSAMIESHLAMHAVTQLLDSVQLNRLAAKTIPEVPPASSLPGPDSPSPARAPHFF